MFGLEGDKKKKEGEFVFDLEKDAGEANKYKELVERIERRTERIKEILRKGTKKEEYQALGILLAGYVAFLRVIGRVKTKP